MPLETGPLYPAEQGTLSPLTRANNPQTGPVPFSASSTTGPAPGSDIVIPTTGDITGFKWSDLNANGFQDPGEPGLGGIVIYLDLNNNQSVDANEPQTLTDDTGHFNLALQRTMKPQVQR